MIFAFCEIHHKWPGTFSLSNGLGKERAVFLRNDDGDTSVCLGSLHGFDGLVDLEGSYHVNIFHPAPFYNRLDGNLASLDTQWFGIDPWMRLVPSHGGGPVVEDDQREDMIVVNTVYESGYS